MSRLPDVLSINGKKKPAVVPISGSSSRNAPSLATRPARPRGWVASMNAWSLAAASSIMPSRIPSSLSWSIRNS